MTLLSSTLLVFLRCACRYEGAVLEDLHLPASGVRASRSDVRLVHAFAKYLKVHGLDVKVRLPKVSGRICCPHTAELLGVIHHAACSQGMTSLSCSGLGFTLTFIMCLHPLH